MPRDDSERDLQSLDPYEPTRRERHEAQMRRMAWRDRYPKADARQEAALLAFKIRSRYDPAKGDFESFRAGVMRDVRVSHRRKQITRSKRTRRVIALEDTFVEPTTHDSPAAIWEAVDQIDHILSRLTPEQRQLVLETFIPTALPY